MPVLRGFAMAELCEFVSLVKGQKMTTAAPPRITPRNLFDVGAGGDNLNATRAYEGDAASSVVNLTNKTALCKLI